MKNTIDMLHPISNNLIKANTQTLTFPLQAPQYCAMQQLPIIQLTI